LIEDVAKLPKLKKLGDDAHFCVSFIKKHGLLFEEFLMCQDKLKVKSELVLFPSTRFAYLFLMIHRVWLNISVLRLVAESPTYKVVKAATKKRGEEGKKALEEFKRFESLVESREFKMRLEGGGSVMEPFSILLHYSEGDSVPLSHVLPCFQTIYDFAQQLDDFEAITEFLDDEDERDEVAECVRKRWLGEGRRVGLKADAHLLAFVLDPFVQAALTSPKKPDCDLLDGEVLEGARAAVRHFSSDDHAKRSVLLQQFMLWNAAAPRLPGDGQGGSGDSEPVAQATGNNAFSALRLSAMDQVWSKVQAREDKMDEDSTPRDLDSSAFAVREEVAKLRLCSSPVEFWLAMMNETPRGATPQQKEAHMLFCKSAADISSIVGHTCGVERAGKAYKQVLSSLRKAMDETRAMKAVYVYSNYNLSRLKQSAGDAFAAFNSAEAQAADTEKDPVAAELEKHTLRRGNLIFKDVIEEGGVESEEEGGEEDSGVGGEGEDGATGGDGVTEVKWSVPEGFKVADEPEKLDKGLVGNYVYLRWERYGWQMGKITAEITNATPRLFTKFNFRITWADGSKGPSKLAAESYACGADARYNSWVILQPIVIADKFEL
jgi:hypothetical protein